MKTSIKLCLLATTIVLSLSCKKRKPAVPGNPEETGTKHTSLPLKITYKGITYNFNYFNDSEKIAEINLSNGNKWLFTHKPEKQIFWIKLHNTKSMYAEIDYRYNDKMQGTTARTFTYKNDNYKPSDSYTFEYNSSDELSKISQHDAFSNLLNEKTITHTINPAASTYTTKVAGKSTEEITHAYDTKNGIFKNIGHTNLMHIYFDQLFFHCCTNNITSISGTDQTTTNITYQYNKENYPVKATITKGKTTEEMTITYIQH